MCRREVELNRRFAPDVYLGVADVHDPAGRVCEHLVVMRRMPPQRRLSVLVDSGEDVSAELRQLAQLLATVRARWMANIEGVHPYCGSVLDPDVVERIEWRARRYVDGRKPLFTERINAVPAYSTAWSSTTGCVGST